MLRLKGTVIRPGLLIGTARKIAKRDWNLPSGKILPAAVETEYALLDSAIGQARRDIQSHLDGFTGSADDAAILNAHLGILDDPDLLAMLSAQIRQNLQSAVQAVQETFNSICEQFKGLDNAFFAQRAADYLDIEHRLLAALTGDRGEDLSTWQSGQIAVLGEATPSQITAFSKHHIPGYCSDIGSYTSHASILTRSLGIPALVGVTGLYDRVQTGDTLILDALEGTVILAPDDATLLLYRQLQDKYLASEAEGKQAAGQPLFTRAGRRVKLRCNVDLLSDPGEPARLGADGIGLYRTEFLYLGKTELPTEDLQYGIYRDVAEEAAPHSVVIRSFDLGGDKLSHLIPSPAEENPYLGNRGIRFSLAQPEIFKTQIRAVLRAAVHGRVKLMFPMISDLREFLQARQIVEDCRAELRTEGVPCADEMPLGVMIEVPSAALIAEELARVCDFLSVGTNDLVQYTLAADRNNSALAPYYIPHHPAVLSLLKTTLAAARKFAKPVSLCGEMASQPEYLPLLIGLGFADLSVAPASLGLCRSIIRRCDAALDGLVAAADLSEGLPAIEELVFNRLKSYYRP